MEFLHDVLRNGAVLSNVVMRNGNQTSRLASIEWGDQLQLHNTIRDLRRFGVVCNSETHFNSR